MHTYSSPCTLHAHNIPISKVLFVESICNDPDILSRNYRMKLSNDDYKGQEPEVALRDFIQRVKKYEKVYEEVRRTYQLSDGDFPRLDEFRGLTM